MSRIVQLLLSNRWLNRVSVRVSGHKLARFVEWGAALKAAGRETGYIGLVQAMNRAKSQGIAGKVVWRERMRTCFQCPVFNSATKTCQSVLLPHIGCKCYMPFKAAYRGNQCWARERQPDGPLGHRQ